MDCSEDPLIATSIKSLPLRILYVEDNLLVREVTAELLTQDDRHIVALGTAEEALQAFTDQPFDVVITDVSLPAMSGLDLARKILHIEPQVPIIVASGYSLDLSLQTWGPKVRAIIKPFDGAAIDALIMDLCGGAEPETKSRPLGPS
jgi:two-component system, cell cycle response regulator CpdR